MELAPLNYIPFQLCRMKSAKVLWVSDELNLSDDECFEKFAFGIPTNGELQPLLKDIAEGKKSLQQLLVELDLCQGDY